MEINSQHIKTVLMYYYRFHRQYIVCDEVRSFGREIADILVDTGKYFIEIEIKTSKADLRQEKRKVKHKTRVDEKATLIETSKYCNKYYLCVPMDLKEYAQKWIEEVNPNYGLILFDSNYFAKCEYIQYWGICLKFVKNSKKFHKEYSNYLKKNMSRRLSSALTNAYAHRLQRSNNG